MTIKVIAFVLITSMSVIAGYKFSEKKKFRAYFYAELVKFCLKLKNEIGFINETVENYLVNLPNQVKNVLFANFHETQSVTEIKIVDKRFTANERTEIENFFSKLCSYDPIGFTNVTNFYLRKFEEKERTCLENYKKNHALYIKISALIGALIFVLAM